MFVGGKISEPLSLASALRGIREPEPAPAGSLGALIRDNTKVVGTGATSKMACDESKVRSVARNSKNSVKFDRHAVNKMSLPEIHLSHPSIARNLNRQYMLHLKKQAVTQIQAADDLARKSNLKIGKALTNFAGQLKHVSEHSAITDTAVMDAAHDLYAEWKSTSDRNLPFSDDFLKKLEHFEGKLQSSPLRAQLTDHSQEIINRVATNAEATAQLEHMKTLLETATIGGRVSRNPGYAWITRMIPSRVQKTGMSVLNAFGMITMVASTPLLLISFKQMYDEFKGPSAQQQQQQ